ncbi:RNA polymerase sigma-70 factor [Reichenbachiella sp. MALMAid0571]|uniref:RNA polymerase sigma factor n=1 Tax=Reichenbachiella sp. MALMAid0571 TaxID=3143939 RepID=UPI0032DE8665
MKNIIFKNNDRTSVLKLKNGDEHAFDELFKKYSKKLYSVSRKMHLDHEEAEGVVQDVFLKIWRNRASLNEELSFNSYLLTIAKSIIIKSGRKKAYHFAYENYALNNSLPYSNQTEDYVIFSDLESFSNECLNSLPKQQKQIFMMKTRDNFSIEEISAELNISKRTVENHFYRACKELKNQLTRHQVISATKIITPLFLLFNFFK